MARVFFMHSAFCCFVINHLTANDALPNYPSTAEAVNAVT